MNSTEYNTLRKQLKLSVVGAADVLGIGQRNAQRYAAGHIPIPEPVARLLRAIVRFDIDPEKLT